MNREELRLQAMVEATKRRLAKDKAEYDLFSIVEEDSDEVIMEASNLPTDSQLDEMRRLYRERDLWIARCANRTEETKKLMDKLDQEERKNKRLCDNWWVSLGKTFKLIRD